MSTSSRRLGQYELQEQLGQGAMAEVWRAYDTRLRRSVAIKILHANLREDPTFVTRFEREARFIASLHHPNIVEVHDFQLVPSADTGSTAYMVMEYIEGQTLAHYIESTSRQGNPPAPETIAQMFASIGLAVQYAHQNGMIHRDLKPANILLDAHNTSNNPIGEPILTDFGFAKLRGTTAGTVVHPLSGSPFYISPEQASGYSGNEFSDIYSLGVILYEMTTGTLPFQGGDPVTLMTQHINATPPPPRLINPNIPPALEAVILRCLAKEPSVRYTSPLALAAAIAEALNVPVPERVGNPDKATGVADMPTYLTAAPNITPMIASTPGVSTAGTMQVRTNPVSSPGLTPARGNPVSSPGLTPAYSNPISSPGLTPALTPSFMGTTPGNVAAPLGVGTPVQAPPQRPQAPRRRIGLVLVVLALVIVLASGGVLAVFLLTRAPAATTSLTGHAFFVSSGQLNDGAQGIADELQVDLQNVPAPPQGKSYALWMLGDKDTTAKGDLLVPPPITAPLLLTSNLPVNNNTINYLYRGDAQHNNLLSITSRLLITLENTNTPPTAPTTDHASWKYYAELPQAYIPNDPTGLRGLDHVRHLYYNEDHIKILGLYGGLDIWALRNTEKVFESAISARDDFDGTTKNYGLMHNLFIGILDYLDGVPNFHVDMPADTTVTADANFAKVALLTVDPTKQGVAQYLDSDPPGDLDHMILHIGQIARAPDASTEMQQRAQAIVAEVGNANKWLQQARTDAKQLFALSAEQLSQPEARILLEDLATQATYAYIGQLDPATNKVNPGMLQAHYDIQKLATFNITTSVPAKL